ncbi:MAG: hypothetical protein JXB36_03790 [Gammaproteobacteria bacterium]|nr:hypothetical protein [Gammaproteobacteria bacterium]
MKPKRESSQRTYCLLHAAAPSRNVAALAGAALLASGCAAVTTADGERLPVASDRFRAYAEGVFRRQNRIATDLAFELGELDPDEAAFDELAAAEDELLAQCEGLNEVAAAARDGERLATGRRLDAARKAPDCERATDAAAAALERHRN